HVASSLIRHGVGLHTTPRVLLPEVPPEPVESPRVRLWRPRRGLHISRSQAAETNALQVGVPPTVERDHHILRDLLDKPRHGAYGRDIAGPPTGLFKIEALREPRA